MSTTVEIPEPPRSQVNGGRPFVTTFLDHLVSKKIVPKEIAEQIAQDALLRGNKNKKTLVEILVEDFKINSEELFDEVAHFYSFKILKLGESNSRRLTTQKVGKILGELPRTVVDEIRKYKVIPFELSQDNPEKVLIASPNPSDREVHRVARAFPFQKFEVCYMKESEWQDFMRQVGLEKQIAISGLDSREQAFEVDEDLDGLLDVEIHKGQLVQMLDNVFAEGVRAGASDIHVIPKGYRKTSISFRIDGQLTEWYSIEDARSEAVVAVVKGRGLGLDRFERMAAQDGSAQKQVDDQTIRYRMSVLPVISREIGGKLESVVIRILKDADASVSLETIGFDQYSLKWFSESISRPHGMIILTGPTGCGKSTTLIAALRSVMRPTRNTITVEDPVEYLIDGARQVKLNSKLSFEEALRAILRHDPDVVMVGEIRDQITADIGIKLANTGHLTFSTLHTNDAPSAISRLFKIGVEPFLIAQALNIVVAQRLLRRLCMHCREPLEHLDDNLLARLGFTQDDVDEATFFRAKGCSRCVNGFKGRVAIHESLYMTPEIRELVIDSTDKVDVDLMRAMALAHGMQTLRASGLQLVKKGISTIEEVASMTVQD